jgi:hypothetical protein
MGYETITYKARDRYSLGWSDPRMMGSRVQIKIGGYTIADLIGVSSGSPHPSKVEIMYRSTTDPTLSMYADKTEFAAYIEAFLKEKTDGLHATNFKSPE